MNIRGFQPSTWINWIQEGVLRHFKLSLSRYTGRLVRFTTRKCFAKMTTGLLVLGLIFIHRNFFARALRENPNNPIRSHFGPSFLAAYASAITLLRAMRRNYESCRRALLLFWSHALASGVCFWFIAIRQRTNKPKHRLLSGR